MARDDDIETDESAAIEARLNQLSTIFTTPVFQTPILAQLRTFFQTPDDSPGAARRDRPVAPTAPHGPLRGDPGEIKTSFAVPATMGPHVRIFFDENKPYTRAEHDALVKKYGAGNVSVSGFEHLYIEGRGGKTGDAWAPDEIARVQKLAATAGMSFEEYRAQGWKQDAWEKIRQHDARGGLTYEIDNIANVRDVIETLQWCKTHNIHAKMLGKNLSADDLQAIQKAFPDYGKFMVGGFNEADADANARTPAEYAKMGMNTFYAASADDTYHYRSTGGRMEGMAYNNATGTAVANIDQPSPKATPVPLV